MIFSIFIDLLAACFNILSAVRTLGAALFTSVSSLVGYTGALWAISLGIATGVYLFVYLYFPKISSYTPATARWTASAKQRNFEHVWVRGDMLLLDHGQGPAYCNACSGLVVQGITCLVCRRCAHKEHHNLVEDMPCKRLYTTTALPSILGVKRQHSKDSIHSTGSNEDCTRADSQELPSPPGDYAHQWVEGNLSLGARCQVCYASAGSEPTLKDMRCIWCDVTVHTTCFTQYRTKCPLGPFPDLVVPPDLVTRISKASRGSTQKSDPRFSVTRLPDEGSRPLLCIVNPASGAQNSAALLRGLFALLNPVQVVDTSRENPEALIRAFEPVIDRCRVLVCGGDGTIQWVISILDKVVPPGKKKPPVGVLPLGTGNDLARVLGWGGGWAGEEVRDIVRDVDSAREVELDRWTVTITEKEFPLSSTEKVGRALYLTSKKEPKMMVMNNYFSVGTDASVALDFHITRLRQPQFFRNRLLNKVWYALFGGKHQFKNILSLLGIVRNVQPSASVLDDENSPTDRQREDAPMPSPGAHEPLSASSLYLDSSTESIDLTDMGALIILNIPSYGGGGKIYAAAEAEGYPLSRFNDGKLEVLAVASPLHLGASVVGLSSPAVLGQAKSVKIEIDASEVAMQVDGEPWLQKGPCTVTLSFLGQTRMLKRKEDIVLTDSGLDTEEDEEDEEDMSEAEEEVLPADFAR
ncbi:uncharacterized protein SPPG_05267 [Spizellomyces punctatus DAOM BR117]|uniref:Diacylglycerol kinase n=1 Tax=Spizellomyces punctatus (strain DAOM BR117) TaxID=645134 RepID=A0A0L0HEK6_SPIPD|nr:uncharacterized protein SPPG_05267 [Spizellomyces punctatus DAOM BR117]KNC99895.1 hypothetical protein SPPG_05267 [Spizellomyces punctatus DAOM BR117]|eukprot:XP_016607935.1 hypothetical protein SPPG_05267 [Spizellomyces punctatus DAOM BR117]